MPTTSNLRRRRHAHFAYLWLLDGCPLAFTDNPILSVGDYTGEDHEIRAYLDPTDMQVEEALDLRSGRLDETSATFVLIDFDGVLGQLFRSEDPEQEPLDLTVYPHDNLAARTELHGRHVGTEAIGPAGQRALYPCVPGFQVGQMHIGLDQELPQHRPAPVTSSPIVWRGRRCCLYRCYIDSDGTRRPFSEAERIWWGTLTDQGSVDGRRWSLEVAGPQSWLQRDLGVLTQRDTAYALGTLELSSQPGHDETRIGVSFSRVGVSTSDTYGEAQFATALTGDTPSDIIAAIVAELNAVQNDATPPAGAFTAANNRYVTLDALGRFTIHTDPDGDNIARLRLTLHAKVWQALGYDPVAQANADGALFVPFSAYGGATEDLPSAGAPLGPAPGPGYITATIDTKDPSDDFNGDNDGTPRQYRPLYEGGVTVLLAGLNDGVGQICDLDNSLGGASIYHRGQLSRPIASDPDSPTEPYDIPGIGACNRQGLWLFYGKRRIAGVGSGGSAGPEYDEYQIGLASWRSGSLAQQGLVLGGRIVVTRWLSPRLFGFDRELLTSDWVARSNAAGDYRIRAVPILALEYLPGNALEEAHVVIERLLRSTGTSPGWSGYSLDPSADPQPGDNNSAGTPPRDAEVEDLGLGIPGSMVANVLELGLEGQALPGNLGRVKVAFSPGMSAAEVLEGIMRPFGWAWTLRGGRYGLFTPTRTPSPAAVDVVLDGSTKLATAEAYSQDLRAFAPIDVFELEYGYAPHLDRFARKHSVDSKDLGRRYRHGGLVERMRSHGMRGLEGWSTKVRDLGVWWGRRHFFVRSWPYMDREPRRVGEFVRISDPRGFDPAGVYGLDGMLGVITRVVSPLRPDDREPFSYLDVLVYAGTAGQDRLHAFAARAFGIDTTNHRIYVRANWLGIPHPAWPGDASRFIETELPGLDELGGSADVTIVQWDGSAWRAPITGRQVVGVGSDANGTYLQLDGAPSEYFHKMDTIVLLAPAGDQSAAWVLARYGVTCSKTRTFDGGTAGYRWEDL